MTLKTFLELIRRGVDWGPVQFQIRWQSPDKRTAIVTWPGHNTWQGVGCRGYHPTEHWFIDLRKAKARDYGIELHRAAVVANQRGGRLHQFPATFRMNMQKLSYA